MIPTLRDVGDICSLLFSLSLSRCIWINFFVLMLLKICIGEIERKIFGRKKIKNMDKFRKSEWRMRL